MNGIIRAFFGLTLFLTLTAASVASAAPSKQAPTLLVWPIWSMHSRAVSQYFHDPRYGNPYHNGIDIPDPQGTPLHAAITGRIYMNRWAGSCGYEVRRWAPGGWLVGYCHMIAPGPVYVGEPVYQGQVVGYIGSTGWSTGPHLHFFLWRGGVYLNPLLYLPPP